MIAPVSDNASIIREWPICRGVSRSISTRRRRSFNVTSAAGVSRDVVTPVANSEALRIEHGATIIPAVRKEPEEINAATSCTAYAWVCYPSHRRNFQIGLVRKRDFSRARHDKVCLDL